jgi:nucleotide-binding universal stress UspA family protein
MSMRILLALDGSEASRRALQAVRMRPWPPGSVIRLVTAVQDPWAVVPGLELSMTMPPASYLPENYEELRQQLREQGQSLVNRLAALLTDVGVEVETAVRQGDPGSSILEEAESWNADLIVLGSRGLSTVKRWLLGSVAQYVVNHAPCSVEVVRERVPEPTSPAGH